MKFWTKSLALLLVMIMIASIFASCEMPTFSNPLKPNSTNKDNTVVPPNGGNNNNSGNHVGGVVVENVTAPYIGDVHISASVEGDEENKVVENVNLNGATASATVPGGVQLEEGATELALTINKLETSESIIELSDTEIYTALDVHVSGVAESNLVPMEVKLEATAMKGLNSTSIKLYHVEDGETVQMTLVKNDEEFTAHNQFKYDPVTGDVTLYIASFSEITVVSDVENGWNGEVDHSWYKADATELVIANAEQLWSFSQIVGGMNGQTQDSFSGKTVKLIADINLGDAEAENNNDIIFYPIGYYNSEGTYERTNTAITSGLRNFEGTFDGNGHKISNFYQNTWEMKGDHNWYSPEEQYYRDGMGLFGRVYGGTVKNLTVENFSSDGEIATTGVIAAYADGATFQNIAIFNCNPRVYNIGNGGIVGCVGWYAKEANLKTTFENITVDNSNMISALWGSYDVACGGIVGQYYPTSGQTSAGKPKNGGIEFINCHVSAIMDVYNDVCANYQYYAYRYTGMLIGSVNENETINGRVYPKMNGITASACTVHFGDWNDYYYCELVDNSTASYTHDYQMSRLTEIKEINGTTITYLDGTVGTVPETGRANYVIVDYTKGHGSENATCYHFKDGVVWNHTQGGYEEKDIDGDGIVDSETLKEDKNHIYLEFNNLVTGYGWGVTSKGIGDLAGVTILDRENGNSVKKFDSNIGDKTIVNQKVYTFSEIFAKAENSGVKLIPGNIKVAITNFDENNPVSATITYDENNWENGTIEFAGHGTIKITIQDYYFCTPTEIVVEIHERQPEEKFEAILKGDFLYRVGNGNGVSPLSLFSAKENVDIQNNLTITIQDALNAEAQVNELSVDLSQNQGIQFTGTGVVKVTISDNDWCEPTELIVEIIDGYNITKYEELNANTNQTNLVLLQSITMSNGGTYSLVGSSKSQRKTLYGNGFTFDVTKGAYSGVKYDYASYVIYLENANLDNIEIVGAVYNQYGGTKTDDYYRAIVFTGGDVMIANSYISNGASPIRSGANLELINTTLKGGIYANLDFRSGQLILDNVTTINQIGMNDKYISGETESEVVGLGIVVYQEGGSDDMTITIKNQLKQYNYLSKAQADEHITNEYANTLTEKMFGNSFTEYQSNIDNTTWINTGIVSMNDSFAAEDLLDERTDKQSYFGTTKSVTVLFETRNVYIYSIKPTEIEEIANYKYTTVGQYHTSPKAEFDFTDKNYIQKTENSNDYCYEDGGIVYISMDEGDTFSWDTSILSLTKNGQTLDYTVTINGTDYTGNSIAFNATNDYTVSYKYVDNMNYQLENGKITTYEVSYQKDIVIKVSVIKAAAKNAVFSFGANGTAYSAKLVTIGDKTYVMPDVSATVSGKIGSTTINGTTVYYPITEMYTSDGKTSHTGSWYACFPIFKDALQIIDYADQGTGDEITYNQTSVTTVNGIPSTLKATNPTSAFLYSMNATNYPPPTDPTAVSGAVCYTSNRNGLSASNTRNEMNISAEFTYTDNAGKIYYFYIGYHCAEQTKGSTPCVTGDTLVTLADGTQQRIDSLTGNELIRVWDFYKGEYTIAPIAILQNHGYGAFDEVKLIFSDETEINTINGHGFFDVAENKFIIIDKYNVMDYVGHEFVKYNVENDYSTVTLVDYKISARYEQIYSILTAVHYNCLLNDLWTVTAAEVDNSPEWLMPYVIGEDMKYDANKMQADIEKYGLYTYEDFKCLCSYEEFVGLGLENFKVSVGKGAITWEEILFLINLHLN